MNDAPRHNFLTTFENDKKNKNLVDEMNITGTEFNVSGNFFN